jgi:hypothetical protein
MRYIIVAVAFVAALTTGTIRAASNEPMAPPVEAPYVRSQQVYPGWNFISIEQTDCQSTHDRLSGLVNIDLLRVAGVFEAESQTWMLYDPAVPSGVNTLTDLCSGDIATVFITEAGPSYSGSLYVGALAKVANTDGDCLRSRSSPNGETVFCLPEGFVGRIDDGPVFAGDHWWWHIADEGWSSDTYLAITSDEPGPGPGSGKVAFYNCEGQNGGYCGYTASGVLVGPWQASCDSSRLGQSFDLAGYIFLCTDTGSGVRGNDVDLWFYTYDEGVAFMAQLDPNAQVYWL